jgi:drug/metabolite transporter superfamily protein YnfA
MKQERAIALTEVYLDQQNALQGAQPRASVRPDVYDVIGVVCAVAGFLLLAFAYWRAL